MLYILNQSGLIFEGSNQQLQEYRQYGSREATKAEVNAYKNPNDKIVTIDVTPIPKVETPKVEAETNPKK